MEEDQAPESALPGSDRDAAENMDGERWEQSAEVAGSLRRKSTESQIANLRILEAGGYAAARREPIAQDPGTTATASIVKGQRSSHGASFLQEPIRLPGTDWM